MILEYIADNIYKVNLFSLYYWIIDVSTIDVTLFFVII